MITFDLHYAKIIFLREDIAEIIPHDGIELDFDTLDEMLHFLNSHLKKPFSILWNKKNSFAYSFDAQKALNSRTEVKRVGVVVYNPHGEKTFIYMMNVSHLNQEKVRMFHDYAKALSWVSDNELGQA